MRRKIPFLCVLPHAFSMNVFYECALRHELATRSTNLSTIAKNQMKPNVQNPTRGRDKSRTTKHQPNVNSR